MRLLNVEIRTGRKVQLASVDQGYRGHETDELLGVTVLMPKDKKRPRKGKGKLSRALRKKLNRRNAIEPTIGHLKHDHRMGRCYLKSEQGDQINALAAAMGLKLLAGLGAVAAAHCVCGCLYECGCGCRFNSGCMFNTGSKPCSISSMHTPRQRCRARWFDEGVYQGRRSITLDGGRAVL